MNTNERIDDLVKTFEGAVTSLERFSKKVTEQKGIIDNITRRITDTMEEINQYNKEERLNTAIINFNKLISESNDKIESNYKILNDFHNYIQITKDKFNLIATNFNKIFEDNKNIVSFYDKQEQFIKEQFNQIEKMIASFHEAIMKELDSSILQVKVELDGENNQLYKSSVFSYSSDIINVATSRLPNLKLFNPGKYVMKIKSWFLLNNKIHLCFDVVLNKEDIPTEKELIYVFEEADSHYQLADLFYQFKADKKMKVKDNLDILCRNQPEWIIHILEDKNRLSKRDIEFHIIEK